MLPIVWCVDAGFVWIVGGCASATALAVGETESAGGSIVASVAVVVAVEDVVDADGCVAFVVVAVPSGAATLFTLCFEISSTPAASATTANAAAAIDARFWRMLFGASCVRSHADAVLAAGALRCELEG